MGLRFQYLLQYTEELETFLRAGTAISKGLASLTQARDSIEDGCWVTFKLPPVNTVSACGLSMKKKKPSDVNCLHTWKSLENKVTLSWYHFSWFLSAKGHVSKLDFRFFCPSFRGCAILAQSASAPRGETLYILSTETTVNACTKRLWLAWNLLQMNLGCKKKNTLLHVDLANKNSLLYRWHR